MKDIYLRFSDEKEMRKQLLKSGFEDIEGSYYHPEVLVDIVGVVQVPVNPGEPETSYTPLDGYHVNLRVINDDLKLKFLKKYTVTPQSPSRIWAG